MSTVLVIGASRGIGLELAQAQLAYTAARDRPEQIAVLQTQRAAEQLKLLYLEVIDEEARTAELLDDVRAAIVGLRDD